jgi:O-antigen ligase
VPNALRSAIAPAYLFICLLLGGSAQGIWQNMVLQLAGVAILAWAATAYVEEGLPSAAKPPLFLGAAGIAFVILQLVPVSPALWAHGARSRIAEGFALLGRPVPPMPMSVTPYESLSTLLSFIPPLALFCAIARARAYRPSWLAIALLAGTVAGILLGALQVSSAADASPWYLYQDTNRGAAVGFFANANHMATLLVIGLPFAAALAASGSSTSVQRHSAVVMILAAVALLLIVGIFLNHSLAGYALAVPVIAASTLILPLQRRWRPLVAAIAAFFIIAAIVALSSSAIGGTRVGQDARTSVQSRQQILVTTSEAIRDYMPFGSGLGSFLRVYRTYESPDTVGNEYVVHAHNDYVELALELGVAGLILMILFLAWWLISALAIWRGGRGGAFARAATIASAAILVHSLVDFPLRTAAIAACFAMCLALMAEPRAPAASEAGELRPTRHIVIG